MLIYMNEAIKDKHPKKPVIVVQRGSRLKYSNKVSLYVKGKKIGEVKFSKQGLKKAPYHFVRAWIELTGVQVR